MKQPPEKPSPSRIEQAREKIARTFDIIKAQYVKAELAEALALLRDEAERQTIIREGLEATLAALKRIQESPAAMGGDDIVLLCETIDLLEKLTA